MDGHPLTQAVTPEDQVLRKTAYMLAHPDVIFHPPRRSDPMWTAVLDGGSVEIRAVDLGPLMDELARRDGAGVPRSA